MRLSKTGNRTEIVNDNGNALPFRIDRGRIILDATEQDIDEFLKVLTGIESQLTQCGGEIIMCIYDMLKCERKSPVWQRMPDVGYLHSPKTYLT